MESVDVSEKGRPSSQSSLPPTSPGKDGSSRRSSDDPTTASATSGRLPSHVFRTSKGNQAEWSMASNESLFSINAGNTSFHTEQLNCRPKYNEFGSSCDLLSISSPLMDLPTTRMFTQMDSNGGDCNASVTDPATAEAINDHLKEQERHTRTLSRLSDVSSKSFAFPILAGDGNKGGSSFQKGSQNKEQQSHPEENLNTPSETPKPGPPQESQSQTNAGSKKWFTCLFCCPSSS